MEILNFSDEMFRDTKNFTLWSIRRGRFGPPRPSWIALLGTVWTIGSTPCRKLQNTFLYFYLISNTPFFAYASILFCCIFALFCLNFDVYDERVYTRKIVVFVTALCGPRRSISESTDSISLDLFRDFPELINFIGTPRFAVRPSVQNVIHPGNALSAGGTLATGLVLIKFHQTPDAFYYVVIFVWI